MNFHTPDLESSNTTTSNEVTTNQKLSYEIYEAEAEILQITKRLKSLREKRKCLEMEEEMKRMGTVETVEKEFKNIFGTSKTPWSSALKKQLKPLFASIVYTLKNLESRLNEEKVHVHNENVPLKFVELPKKSEESSEKRVEYNAIGEWTPSMEQALFTSSHDQCPVLPSPSCDEVPCEGKEVFEEVMNEIWSRNDFEIADQELVAEVLCGLKKAPTHLPALEFNPIDGNTYCSDKPNNISTD